MLFGIYIGHTLQSVINLDLKYFFDGICILRPLERSEFNFIPSFYQLLGTLNI